LQRKRASAWVFRKQPAAFLGGIEQDRSGLGECKRLALRPIVIDDDGDESGGIELQELGGALLALREIHLVCTVGQACLFEGN
jgi:hypothetical protein